MRARAHARFVVSWFVSCAHPRNGADLVSKGANAGNRPPFQRCASFLRVVAPLWLTGCRFVLYGAVVVSFALSMARQTLATLTARVGVVSRALGLPLHPHTGADGFAVGALRLVRADGLWSLFQLVNNAGAGDCLVRGDAGDVVAFLDGMVAASNVVAVAQRARR